MRMRCSTMSLTTHYSLPFTSSSTIRKEQRKNEKSLKNLAFWLGLGHGRRSNSSRRCRLHSCKLVACALLPFAVAATAAAGVVARHHRTSNSPRRYCTLAARRSQQQQHPAAPPPALTRAREEWCRMARVMGVTASHR